MKVENIYNLSSFLKCKSKFGKIFNNDKVFPANIFQNHINCYIAFEYDWIDSELFFDGMKSFLGKMGDGEFIYYTISPSPEKYLYPKLNYFGVALVNREASFESFSHFLNGEGKYLDAPKFNTDTIAIFSDSMEWGIIGSRDWELGIFGGISREILNTFIDSFEENRDMYKSIKEQVMIYSEMFQFGIDQWENYSEILSNYEDKL